MKNVLILFIMLVGINTASAQQIIFQDGFEGGQFDPNFWTARPSIAGAAGGRVEVVNSIANARTGSFSVFIGRTSDGQSTTNALDLRLNLAGRTQVELRFWLRDFFDEPDPEEGLYFSSDGGQNFLQVATFGIDNETEDIYLDPPPIDVDALAAAKGLALTSTFVIRFQQIGTRDFNGSAGADGFIIDDVSVTVPQIEYARLPFTDGFEDGVFRPMWHESNVSEPAVGQVTAPVSAPSRRGGRVDVVNSIPNARTGTFSAFIGRTTDGEPTTNALDLRLNLAGRTQVELRFWLRDFFDEPDPGEGLYFSADGGQNFVQVATFGIDNETEDIYLDPPPIDVDALASANGLALTSTFVIRFQQIGTRDFNGSAGADGFIIDDVSVTVPQIEYARLPFTDGFEDGVFRPMWHESNASEPAVGQMTSPVFAPSRRGGRVDVVNSNPNARTGTFSVFIGRWTDGELTTNALDLRLNLAGHTQVELRYWLRDFFDQIQQGEGLYFSDNGGQSFVMVAPFDIENETEDAYLDPPPLDIDALAAANGLSLTSTFVIRFQQIGSRDFNGAGGANGFIIDDVSVTVPQIEYALLPFEEGFETGAFRPMWHEENASEPAVGEVTAPVFAPSRRGGRVEVVNFAQNARTGTNSVYMGRSFDGQSTTNALDLRLNLTGNTQVELRFWLKDFFDETQQQEGLYFSDDSGKNFVQVLELDPSSHPDNQYTQVIVNLDALAAANGLALTSSFIIRFQQIGSSDFNGAGGADGFIIDDVSVIGNPTSVLEENDAAPTSFAVSQNYPNPFNPSTQISFALPSSQRVTLKVFDLTGKEVATLLQNEHKAPGVHQLMFDAAALSSGVYFYQLRAGEFVETKKMLLAR